MKETEHTIIKSNALLEAKYSFSLLETKLLLSVISQIKRDDKNFHRYRVYLLDFKKLIEKEGITYHHLRNTSRSLKSKVVEIETDTGHLITSYVSDIKLYKNEGYIDFWVSPLLKPYLLELKSQFTIYDIRNVIQCSSSHSIRIYQLLKQYESIGNRTITVDDFKKMLGFNKKEYTRFNNLRARIIDVAKKDLEKHSDLYFTYTLNRKGRRIHSIKFKIMKKKQRRMFDTKQDAQKDAGIIDYQKDAIDKIKQLEIESEGAVPIPDELKGKI
jgi:plasmid replication initiation protein